MSAASAATANAGRKAGAEASTARMVAACEELVFLTDVYGLTEEDARRQLGRSDEACRRYRKHIRENPDIRLRVLAVYGDDNEELD